MKYLLSFLLVSVSLITFAQKGEHAMMHKNDFTPEQQAILQTKKMTLSLDLNTSQQSQVLAMNKKQTAEKVKKMEMHKSMKESGKKMTSDEKFNMMNKMLDAKIAHQNEMKKILNEGQYVAWKKMEKHKMMKIHKKGMPHKSHDKKKMMKKEG